MILKTIKADIETYDWQTEYLGLKNSELYVFAFIFNYFKNNLRSYDIGTKECQKAINCSDPTFNLALKKLIDKNLVYKWVYKDYSDTKTYYVKPALNCIYDAFINANIDFPDSMGVNVEFCNHTYSIPLNALSLDLRNEPIPTDASMLMIPLSLITQLDIKGIDLLIMSEMYYMLQYDNTYRISYRLQLITGETDESLYNHMCELEKSKLIYKDTEVVDNKYSEVTWHINTELFTLIRCINTNDKYKKICKIN
jgi:hypothetical protein